MKKFLKQFKVVDKSDGWINFVTIFLALIGLVMAVSASMTAADNSYRLLISATLKQFIYFVISYLLMVFISKKFNYRYFKNLIMPISIAMIGMLLFTLFFDEVNGAQAWIRLNLGFMQFTLQPSEFAKVSTILLVAMYVGDVSPNTKRSSKQILGPVITIIAIQAFIVLFLQDDLGSAIVLLMVAVATLLIPSHPKIRKQQNVVILLLVIGVGLTGFLLTDAGLELISKTSFLRGYQLARFTDYANPFLNITGSGYQLAGSLVAFSRGGLFGVGLGQSVQKYGYLPEARTDFILSLIAEEIGFIGVLIIMVLYAILIWRLISYALKVVSEKDKVVLLGTVAYLFVHILFNVGGITAAIPLTGVPLLLLSSGGSSTLAIMLSIGISQNIISKYRKSPRGRKSWELLAEVCVQEN